MELAHRLNIATTWDGQPIASQQQTQVSFGWVADRLLLDVDAAFHGDPAPSEPVGSTWQLWQHEVVELFLLGADQRYLEIELSPHGHHLVLELQGARNIVRRGLPVRAFDPVVEGSRWSARAELDASLCPAGCDRANAYAIWGVASERRYGVAYTVGEPTDTAPDFHRIHQFRPFRSS